MHLRAGIINQRQTKIQIWLKLIILLQLSFEGVIFLQTAFLIYGVSNAILVAFKDQVQPSSEISTGQTPGELPDLDVIIPIINVNPVIFEKTLNATLDNGYPLEKLHVYVADDTRDPKMVRIYQKICEKYEATFIHSNTNTKFKSGMLNITLKQAKSDFIAFFDYDQVPTKGILKHFVELHLVYPKAAFIQGKKVFTDLNNISKVWSSLLYLQYFEVFQRTKSISDTVLFAGSTACFRRTMIDLVGGIPEDTFTEDNGLAVKLLLAGHSGFYTGKTSSTGTVPQSYSDQISQLWRWSHGASHVLRNNFKAIIKNKNLKSSQKLDVIGTLGIGPVVVIVYLYTISFLVLILNDVDSRRLVFAGFTTVALVPIISALTYLVIAIIAIWLSQLDETSEFRFSHLPGFLLLALAGNLLVISSGLSGIMGWLGPNSPKGKWNHVVHIKIIATVSFFFGLMGIFLSILWMNEGFISAQLILVMGLTLLPSLPVALYYRNNYNSKEVITTIS